MDIYIYIDDTKFALTPLKQGFLDQTGFSTNPKGQHRLWRITRACNRAIEFLTQSWP